MLGIDSSPEMIAAAELAASAAPDTGRLRFSIGDVRNWRPTAASVDVVVSNATLQWIPEHLELLTQFVAALAPGGWLAVQVPANFDQPSHTIRDELAAAEPYAEHLRGVSRPAAPGPERYLEVLTGLGCTVDAWETTYLHRLTGADPVFDWVTATGARPTLAALPAGLREQFAEEFRRRLRTAYPAHDGVVVMPFRRVFAVARTAVSAA